MTAALGAVLLATAAASLLSAPADALGAARPAASAGLLFPSSDPSSAHTGTADGTPGGDQSSGDSSSDPGSQPPDPGSATPDSTDSSDPVGSTAPPAPVIPDTGPTGPSGPAPAPASLPNGIVLRNGRASLTRPAPAVVQAAVQAANRLQNRPYRYGGGHTRFNDRAYDCSGAVSYILHAAGLLQSPLDSRGLAHWGQAGPGRWITVYANRGHAFMFIAGLRVDTSGQGASGPRWRTDQPSLRGFKVRHPYGL